VRQRDDRRARIDADAPDRFVGPLRAHADAGQALGGGEGAARVDHVHLEAGHRGHRRECLRDVHGADDDQPRRARMAAHEQRFVGPFPGPFERAAAIGQRAAARFVELRVVEDEVAAHRIFADQRLRAVAQARDHRERAPCSALGQHRIEESRVHRRLPVPRPWIQWPMIARTAFQRALSAPSVRPQCTFSPRSSSPYSSCTASR